MHATVGDRVHIKGRNVGMQEHVGEVLEVRGLEGVKSRSVVYRGLTRDPCVVRR
jgi:hypothetical protein